MNSYEELRQEFTKDSFREMLKDKLGDKCANCGSEDLVEYHHVVPLVHGGTNNLGNIVPLCHECHLKAHNKHNHGDAYKKAKEEGRVGRTKKTTYEKALPILERYFNNEIGLRQAKKELGLAPKNKSSWYKLANRYRLENNISPYYRNTIDILNSKNS